MRDRTSKRSTTTLAGCLAVAGLAAATLAGGLATLTSLDGGAVAGADTTPYTLNCDLNGTPLTLPGAITTGSLPSSVTAGTSFSLSNYGIEVTLPASGVFLGAAGATVNGTYTTDIDATGAMPPSQSTTFDIPTQKFPSPLPPGGVPLSATASSGSFTANSSGGVTLNTSATSTLAVSVDGSNPPLTLNCTEAPTQIAAAPIGVPHTTVTSVLPNAGPLAGGTSVTIAGTSLSGATAVDFGSTPATITADSADSVTVTAPPGAAGTVDVTVATSIGTSAVTPSDHFTYTAGPIVTGVSPDHGLPDGGTTVTISGQQLTGATGVDFGTTLATGFTVNSDSSITATSPSGQAGPVDVTVTNAKGTSVVSSQDRFTYQSAGYWTVAADGGIFAYGGAGFFGSEGGRPLDRPIVGMAATPDDQGYWEVASDGGIFAFGDAGFFGSMGGQPLNKPIVAMASTPDGGGYWEVASDGGIFAFGDAQFFGSTGAAPVASPIVDLVAAPSGQGYWEIAVSGAIYAFGDTGIYGSVAGQPLNAPIVGAATTSAHNGDWEAASDGGIFTFGSATFYGSMGGQPLNAPMVGMAAA